MNARQCSSLSNLFATAAIVLSCAVAVAQTGSAPDSAAQARRQVQHQAQNQSPAMQPPSEQDVAETQTQFLKLLRLSPVLTSVVARDPSLLSDQDYVARNNPELAQFMVSHPDIAKNPEFYLFSRLDQRGGHRDQALERAVWPDLVPQDPYRQSNTGEVMNRVTPIILFPCFLVAIVWIIYLFIQSSRWNRAFKQQSEIHSRLIDKFSSSQELAAYMETEAGKQFLSASAYAPGPQAGPHMPNVVARVITPMQVGVVLTLLGIGLYFLRNAGPDMATPMAVLGTLALMPGIGFILSAGATWAIAQRLGLMPEKADHDAGTSLGPTGRQ
ncbi:membrane hypothetical protein [Candidatus Sulfotelmatomonas gaucii]|uniref:Uncharacterized protein n=1 Tax=Candidatus Sulfuritelmatomonas gaucii TaxID=2043161 RepID=A0A2N9L675_9BACT|nr:membrane hypothetical protein [Candidatus Sulfotelmatomonas gaucii]